MRKILYPIRGFFVDNFDKWKHHSEERIRQIAFPYRTDAILNHMRRKKEELTEDEIIFEEIHWLYAQLLHKGTDKERWALAEAALLPQTRTLSDIISEAREINGGFDWSDGVVSIFKFIGEKHHRTLEKWRLEIIANEVDKLCDWENGHAMEAVCRYGHKIEKGRANGYVDHLDDGGEPINGFFDAENRVPIQEMEQYVEDMKAQQKDEWLSLLYAPWDDAKELERLEQLLAEQKECMENDYNLAHHLESALNDIDMRGLYEQ